MKIFNWVHRRFNNNNKAEQNAKNNGDIDDEQYFSVDENKGGNHVLERWRGGILTIGTLGYDPLKDENEQLDDYNFYEEEDDEEEEEETEDEEQNPLVDANAEVEMAENWSNEEEHEVQQFGYEYMMMKKQERTTLADLFSADHAHDADDLDQDHDHDQKQAIMMNKKPAELLLKERSNHRKHALSKLIIAKDARPIHKFNQLMRRMLKRKIHPDVGPINSATSTDDSASLLPTQVIADANI